MRAHSYDATSVDRPVDSDGSTVSGQAATWPSGSRWRAVRDAAGAVVGAVLGIAPHVLHHVGLVAGTALVAGTSGNALFYGIGLVCSMPMLRRLHRHFSSWWAPAVALAVFTGLFSVSAFVVGPAIAGDGDPGSPSVPTRPSPIPTDEHGH